MYGKITWHKSDSDYEIYYQKITDRLDILISEVNILESHKYNIKNTKMVEKQMRNEDGSAKVNENGTVKFEWTTPLNLIKEPMDENYRLSLKANQIKRMEKDFENTIQNTETLEE